MTVKGERQAESWLRRGHAVTCWQDHERCALMSARDMLENRAAHIKAQGRVFREALENFDRTGELDPLLFEAAKRALREYHIELRSGRAK